MHLIGYVIGPALAALLAYPFQNGTGLFSNSVIKAVGPNAAAGAATNGLRFYGGLITLNSYTAPAFVACLVNLLLVFVVCVGMRDVREADATAATATGNEVYKMRDRGDTNNRPVGCLRLVSIASLMLAQVLISSAFTVYEVLCKLFFFLR